MRKNKIIQLRGCNAVGKTTTIKQFIDNFKDVEIHELKIDKYKSKITSINNNEIIILGTYQTEKKCCGCDADYENRDHIIRTLHFVMKKIKPQTIIYEGMIYGKTAKMAIDVSNLCKILNYKYVGIYLYRDFESCIELLEERNEGKKYNIYSVKQTYDCCYQAYTNLVKRKANIKKVDVNNIKKEDMGKILLEEIYE